MAELMDYWTAATTAVRRVVRRVVRKVEMRAVNLVD